MQKFDKINQKVAYAQTNTTDSQTKQPYNNKNIIEAE